MCFLSKYDLFYFSNWWCTVIWHGSKVPDVPGKSCFSRSLLLKGAPVAVNSSSWAELGWFRALADTILCLLTLSD